MLLRALKGFANLVFPVRFCINASACLGIPICIIHVFPFIFCYSFYTITVYSMSLATPYSIICLLFELTLLTYRYTLASPFLSIPDDELSWKRCINSTS